MTKTFLRRALSLLLAVLTLTGSVLLYSTPEVSAASELTDATVKSYEARIDALAQRQKEILANITSLRNKQASWKEQKALIDSYLNTVQQKIEAAEILQMELEGQIAVANTEIST